MTRVVIAEKPSVARDLARALGAKEKAEGYLHGNGYTVTWAIGHLVALAEPHEINPAWKRWRAEDLPILPERWPLKVLAKTRKQFTIVKRLLTAKATTEVICATDAGREGELIFRYVQEQAGCRKPVRRLWISSLTPEAIRDGFARLRDGAAFDALADAARGRSRADWLVGMNLSRVYTLQSGEAVSVGRVQTPTLSLLVDREQEIAAFVPEDYLEVVASFRPTGAEGVYVGTYFDPERVPKKRADGEVDTSTRLPAEGPRAAEIAARALRGAAVITSIDRATRRIPPPLLYDLTELQRHANRLYGYSAKQTLDAAQKLYERHKLISYPRTDSRHLSRDVAATLPELVEGPAAAERAIDPARVAPGTGERPLGPRFVDDARVTDHHAILPTRKRPTKLDPDSIEGRLYELICRRLLAAWHDDHVYATTTVINEIKSDGPEGPIVDHYRSRGREVCQVGWKILDPTPLRARKRGRAKDEDDDDSGEPALPVGLAKGQPQDVIDARSVAKRTRPPPRFTESTLLTAMETAGKTLEDRELADAMRERGLGTPATRAAIIETLLARKFVLRKGKSLSATDKGIALIEAVHPQVKSPAMTGEWEHMLRRIERGEAGLERFMAGIADYVTGVVCDALGRPRPTGQVSQDMSMIDSIDSIDSIAAQATDAAASAPRQPDAAATARAARASAGTDAAPSAGVEARVARPVDDAARATPPRSSSAAPAPRSDDASPGAGAPAAAPATGPGATPSPARAGTRASQEHVPQDMFEGGAATTRVASRGSARGPGSAAATSAKVARDPGPARAARSAPSRAQPLQTTLFGAPEPARRPSPARVVQRVEAPARGRGEPARAPRSPAPAARRREAAAPARLARADDFDFGPPPEFAVGPAVDELEFDDGPSDLGPPPDYIDDFLRRSPEPDPGPPADAPPSRPATTPRFDRGPTRAAPSAERRAARATADTPHRASGVPAPIAPPGDRDRLRRAPTPPERLDELLAATFHFDRFRPHQRQACESVTRGEHVLLVMPTGAGKSLCYQLPGLARGGTTLVVSPLIALMEDQVAKLCELGLAADRIHSGRESGAGAQVYRDYLSGRLDFLFAAPERLGVPGFVDMLARRKPTLIAIDEAHCISQWGHDFRPDYRMIGERLPALAPTPIVALTATATPEVQRDIIVQLGVGDVRTYIHGFRRDNLAVEIAELRPSERGELTRQILMGEGRLPAIVYAPTRKQAEALAKDLGKRLRAAAYHAGMDAARRDRVQAQFLAGRLDAIVATIAFGMGIDKPDIRTVIHTALPSSVEGYYQEIGRAGRDGRPSRALLLHSYADRRTQEFFVQRDYPDPRELEDIYDLLSHRPRSLESLRRRLGVDRETLERRLEKLWIHGGARVEDEHALRGDPAWERSYTAQRAHKEGQLENMARFATGADCRMVQFIRHFGDQEDDGEPCGRCDICAPQGCLAKRTRATRDDERRQLDRIVAALREDGAVATGKLYRERFEGTLDRNEFEALLAALAQAGIVTLRDESFRKDGRTIAYRRVELSARGVRLAESDDDDDVEIHITESRTGGGKKKAARKRGAELSALEDDADPELVEALRDWRSERARRTKVPAYRILTNKALAAIAAARPKSLDALAVIHGVGPKVLERHGPDILKIVRGS